MKKTRISFIFLLLFAQANNIFGMQNFFSGLFGSKQQTSTTLGKRPTLAMQQVISPKRRAGNVPELCRLNLCEFAGDIFANTPEFSSGWKMRDHLTPKVSAKAFEALIETFVEQTKAQMLTPEVWTEDAIPAPSHPLSQHFAEYFNLGAKIEMNTGYGRADINRYPFVQKEMTYNENAQYACIGDLHGSLHSLLRILLNLHARGYLNNDLQIINDNFYLIFTGDLIDRGRHGAEVVYLTLLLKCLNPNNVFLIRGNHESWRIASQYGFVNEMYTKFGNEKAKILLDQLLDHVFNLFPYALFLTPNGEDYIQFCHGGIDPGFSPSSIIDCQKQSCFYMIPTTPTGHLPGEQDDYGNYPDAKFTNYEGLNWSDFRQESKNSDPDKGAIYKNFSRGIGYVTDTIYTSNQYLQKNPGLCLIIRGHEDRNKSFKMLFSLGNKRENIQTPKDYEYSAGPYPWEMVVSCQDYERKHFKPCEYFPVLTCSTATEGQGVESDGFIILSAGTKRFDQWTVEVVEHVLTREPSDTGWFSHTVVSPEGLAINFFPAEGNQRGGLDVAIPQHAPELATQTMTPEVAPVNISNLSIQEDLTTTYFDEQSPRYPWDFPLKVLKIAHSFQQQFERSFDHNQVNFDRELAKFIETFKSETDKIFRQIAEQLRVILDAQWEDGASCLSTSSKKIDRIVILQFTNNLMFQHYFEHYLRYFLCMLGLIDKETKIYSLMSGYSCEQADSMLLPEHQYAGYEPIRFFTLSNLNQALSNSEDETKTSLVIGLIGNKGESDAICNHYFKQIPNKWPKITFPIPYN